MNKSPHSNNLISGKAKTSAEFVMAATLYTKIVFGSKYCAIRKLYLELQPKAILWVNLKSPFHFWGVSFCSGHQTIHILHVTEMGGLPKILKYYGIQAKSNSSNSPTPVLLLLLRRAQGTPLYLGNRESYHRSAGVKTTGKILSVKKSQN